MSINWHSAVNSAMEASQGRIMLSSVGADRFSLGYSWRSLGLSPDLRHTGKYGSNQMPGFLTHGTSSTPRDPWLCLVREAKIEPRRFSLHLFEPEGNELYL